MPRRSDARKCVLQMLYLLDRNPDADLHRIRATVEQDLKNKELIEFAWQMITGVRECQDELDQQITNVAQNWRIERMAPTDRNAIRAGLFEMQQVGTPAAVVLNETVELARTFGTEHSSSFVNGILDKLKPEQTTEAPTSEETQA
ncbi:MAG TPA: transcription antitermination factor NusB [Planctomycetes bacterium]|nr:transcription antitermination factor NusB [Fuerstiella sp.]HIK94546.1 transcription antitermination factor NusB [Planctomycetota bacterium]